MRKYLWDRSKIDQAVKESVNYTDVLRKLDIPTAGNNIQTLKRQIEKYNISINHFTFRSTLKQIRNGKDLKKWLKYGTSIQSSKLKEKLLKEGLKNNICEKCGLKDWKDNILVMQLHHIDGDSKNNILENLQMLCPNCHSQTENYCGNANTLSKQKYFCPDCGREINKTSRHCLSCAMKIRNKNNGKIKLTKEELVAYKEQGFSKIKIGQMCNVTEAAIRKWEKEYNI